MIFWNSFIKWNLNHIYLNTLIISHSKCYYFLQGYELLTIKEALKWISLEYLKISFFSRRKLSEKEEGYTNRFYILIKLILLIFFSGSIFGIGTICSCACNSSRWDVKMWILCIIATFSKDLEFYDEGRAFVLYSLHFLV